MLIKIEDNMEDFLIAFIGSIIIFFILISLKKVK